MLQKALIPAAIVVAALLIAALMFLGRPAPERRPVEPRLLPVEVVSVRSRPVQFEFTSQGNVVPANETSLVAEVNGTILELGEGFLVGAFVAAGEVLARVDPRDYETAVARSEATLAGRLAQLEQESARADQAQRDWQSMGRGEASALVLRTPFVAEAEAEVRAAEADLAAARTDLERTAVRAPYAGLVLERRADLGQFLGGGTVLGRIAAVDWAEVRLSLTEADAAFIDLPKGVGVGPDIILETVSSGHPEQWRARIVRSEGVVDPRTRLINVVAEIQDPYALQREGPVLPLGSFVQARIPGRTVADLIEVPRSALRGGSEVFVVDDGDRLQSRQVEVLRADAGSAWIRSGLQPGERVVLTVLDAAVVGTPVQILEPAQEQEVPNWADTSGAPR